VVIRLINITTFLQVLKGAIIDVLKNILGTSVELF
jgi:hypothetical protein